MTGIPLANTINAANTQHAAYKARAGQDVFHAIQSASRKTGVDFGYLLEQAAAESNFQTDVKAKTSSATGLYQFLDQTWLSMVAKHGYKHGMGHLAQHIDFNAKGKALVADPNIKSEILNLRKDPVAASNMAAELAKDNAAQLSSRTDITPGATDMYLAHFLGAGGASRFINARQDQGAGTAAQLFPAAAKANQAVFYDKSGEARSLDEVYAFFDAKFTGMASSDAAPAVADKAYTPRPSAPAGISGAFEVAQLTQDMAYDLANSLNVSALYEAQGSGFTGFNDLYRVQNAIDVQILSDIVSSLSYKDATDQYAQTMTL